MSLLLRGGRNVTKVSAVAGWGHALHEASPTSADAGENVGSGVLTVTSLSRIQ